MKTFCSSLLLLLYCFANLQANSTSLIFLNQEEKDTKFKIWINGVLQTCETHNDIKITKVPTPFCKVKVVFEQKSLGTIEQNIYAKQYVEYIYIVKIDPIRGNHLCYEGEKRGENNSISSHRNNETILLKPKESKWVKSGRKLCIIEYNEIQTDPLLEVKDLDKKIKKKKITSKISKKSEKEGNSLLSVMVNTVDETTEDASQWCETAMGKTKFSALLEEIESEKSEHKKKQLVKQLITCNCLSFKQLAEMLELFKFDRVRLDVARFAYHFVVDEETTADIHDAFEFENSIKKWTQYVKKTKK